MVRRGDTDRFDGRSAREIHVGLFQERGATAVENALCVSILFVLFAILFEFGYTMMVRSVLEEGTSQGMKLAQRLGELEVDLNSLEPNRDAEKLEQFLAARQAVLDAAVAFPLQTMVDRFEQSGMARLLNFQMSDAGTDATLDIRLREQRPAALIRAGEQYDMVSSRGTTRVSHPSRGEDTGRATTSDDDDDCEDDDDGRRGRSTERSASASRTSEDGSAFVFNPSDLRQEPMVLRMCAEVRHLIPGLYRAFTGNDTSILCASSVGYFNAVGRPDVRIASFASPRLPDDIVVGGPPDDDDDDDDDADPDDPPDDDDGDGRLQPFPRPECGRCRIVYCFGPDDGDGGYSVCTFDRSHGKPNLTDPEELGDETKEALRDCDARPRDKGVSPVVDCTILTSETRNGEVETLCNNIDEIVNDSESGVSCAVPIGTPPPAEDDLPCYPDGRLVLSVPDGSRGTCAANNDISRKPCCSGRTVKTEVAMRGCRERWYCGSEDPWRSDDTDGSPEPVECQQCGVIECVDRVSMVPIQGLCTIMFDGAGEDLMRSLRDYCQRPVHRGGLGGRPITVSEGTNCGGPAVRTACADYLVENGGTCPLVGD